MIFEQYKNYRLQVSGIQYSSSVDGEGFRDVLFLSGCPHNCDGCHNPQTHDYNAGESYCLQEVYDKLTQSSITNITFSGGEPFEQAAHLLPLAIEIKKIPKTIWIYSGYTFEQLMADKYKKALLELCDVLVDGKFEKNNRRLNMKFKGSYNQRIIDVPQSFKKNSIILKNIDEF